MSKQRGSTRTDARRRRHVRVRKSVVGTSQRPRLSVYRSNRHLAVQLIDDQTGKTIASASTAQKDLKGSNNLEAAKKLGSTIASKAKAIGVEAVVFDRGGYLYHGRVAAVADSAREAGLKF